MLVVSLEVVVLISGGTDEPDEPEAMTRVSNDRSSSSSQPWETVPTAIVGTLSRPAWAGPDTQRCGPPESQNKVDVSITFVC